MLLRIAGWVLTAMAPLFAQVVEYDRQVHPILAAKCYGCHSQEKRSGGFSLATYGDLLEGGRSGAAIRPGNSADSLLVKRVNGERAPRMPIGGAPLSAAEVATIGKWIDEGARATPASAPAKPKWEAPLTLTSPAVPAAVWKNWQGPIDRFTAAYLASHGMAEPALVSDAVFARRAYLDTGGLLPAPDELRAFLADGKRPRLVEALLADDRRYAENWISFWNDLLRNDEGVNYHSETASRKSITPWLLGALESNLPYDQFVGKLLNPAAPSDPFGFLIGVNWRGVVNASQTPAMQAAQNTAQIFLGINLKCNSCHDSFISKWKLKDAYALATYFSPEEKLQLYRCDVAQEEFAEPSFLFPELNRAPASGAEADRRAAAAAIFTDPRNGRLARTVVNRIWQRLFGRGIVENPDEMDGEPWSPELLDWLAADFADHGYDLKRLISTILTSRTYQMPAAPGGQVFRGPEVRRLTAEQFADAISAITGEWHVYQPPSPPVPPGTPPPTPLPGVYARDWHVAADPLTRALGRPIRDQVYGTRDTQATTLQALELVNGATLTHWLARGARRMRGELPPEPVAVFDQLIAGRNPTPPAFDVDISQASKLWLVVQDTGTYSPEKMEAAWAGLELVGPNGVTAVSGLKAVEASGVRDGEGPVELNGFRGDGVRVKTPSRVVYEIAGMGFTRLRGMVGIENPEVTSDLNPRARFFVFLQEPTMDHLAQVEPGTPVAALPPVRTAPAAVDRVFWYALGRAPSAEERVSGVSVAGSAEGLADLLWAVLMKPEFQLVR